MLVSQVMLSAFVVQWLVSQYKSAEQQLGKNISTEFVKTEQQYTDSILVRNFIDPILVKNDSIVSKLSRLYKTGLSDKNESVSSGEETGLGSPCESVEDLGHVADIPPGKKKESAALTEPISGSNKEKTAAMQEKILMQGTELFLNEVCDISDSSSCMTDNFYNAADTMLFDSLLLANLAGLGIRPSITRTGSSKKPDKDVASFMNLESSALKETIRLNITGLPAYLISKIAYPILFAFILLLLTAISFWFAFRNLKNEMQLNALKSNLIGNISHELKTPVSTVKIAIEALQHPNFKNDENKTREYLKMAHLEVNRLELLIDKIMTTAELETDNAMLTLQQDDLKKIIQKLLDSMQIVFAHHHANATLHATDQDYMVGIDALHFEGVLKNLLDNSLKYGNENPVITISLHQNEQEVLVWVSDNGPGIPDEYADRVFDKFFRIPTGNKHPVKGYGLGLSYAALVMQQHHGKIEVKNNTPDPGCTFILHFKKYIAS